MQPSSSSTYFRLLGYAKPHWKIFVFSIFGYLLYSSSQPMLASMAGWLADTVYNRNQQAIYLIPLTLLAIYLIRGMGSFIGNYYLSKVSFSVIKTLRDQMFDHLVLLPNRFYEQNNSGHLISMITYNVDQVAQAITDAIRIIIREGITVIALLAYIFYLNWKLTLAFIVVAPIIALIVSYVSKRFKRLSKNIQVSMGDLTHVSSEAINGYKEVKSFGGQSYESHRFHRASENNYRQNMKMTMTAAINTPVLQMIVAASLAALIFVALNFMHEMSPDAFIAYITAAGLLPKPIRQLSDVNAAIQKGIAAAESIFKLIDEETEKDTGHVSKKNIQGRIQFRDIVFSYHGGKPVIDHLNLIIEPGQTVAIVGRSGSGKTTLSNLVPRFYELDSGQILIDDTDIRDYSLENLRSHIALVSQQITLFNDTIANNIAYGSLANYSEAQIIAAAEAAFAMDFIRQMEDGMNTLIGEDGVLLSGGQRQRLAIARALLKDAPILILDEATSALDNESETKIQQALNRVIHGRTTLIIAHRLSTISKADHIIVMDQGRIVESGNHTQLLQQRGIYYQLYQNQFQNK